MGEIYNLSLTELLNREQVCDCGKKHTVNAEVRYGENTSELTRLISEISPNGKVAFVSLHDTFIRRGTHVLDAVSAGGAVPLNIVLNKRFDNTLENVNGLFGIPDDVRAVLVTDDALYDVAAYFSALKNLPLIIIPSSAYGENVLSPIVTVTLKGVRERIAADNRRYVIIDETLVASSPEQVNAAAFAGMASGVISLIDYRMRGTVAKENLCRSAYDLARSCISDSLSVGKLPADKIPLRLLENRLKGAVAEIYTDGDILCGGGETAVAALLSGRGEQAFSESERKLAAACKLIELYNVFFTEPHGELLSVPDYGERAERLSVRTGIKQSEILDYISEYSFKAKDIDKILRFVMPKFAKETQNIAALTVKLMAVYEKLGGSALLKTNYSPEELRAAVFSAADMPRCFSVLTLMRDVGMLEYLKN